MNEFPGATFKRLLGMNLILQNDFTLRSISETNMLSWISWRYAKHRKRLGHGTRGRPDVVQP